MAQRAVMIRIDSNLIPEIFHHVPDYEELVVICKDHDYSGDEIIFDYYLAEYEWIEIGEGESGLDEFLDEETLLAIYDQYDYAKHIQDLIGKNVELIESGSIKILYRDIQEAL